MGLKESAAYTSRHIKRKAASKRRRHGGKILKSPVGATAQANRAAELKVRRMGGLGGGATVTRNRGASARAKATGATVTAARQAAAKRARIKAAPKRTAVRRTSTPVRRAASTPVKRPGARAASIANTARIVAKRTGGSAKESRAQARRIVRKRK